MSKFKEDLALAKPAEQLVKRVIAKAGYEVSDVADIPEYYHKGDLKITLPSGERFIEVKNDSRIADTQNILCEEEVYFKETDRYEKGFMYSDYDIYAIVSQSERAIYFFKFDKLKEIYKTYGEYRRMNYPEQYSDTFLLPLHRATQFGAFITKINY